MSNNLIDREITQGIIPIGTPKAYKYDAALVEAAKATVQQGMTGIAEKTEEEKTAGEEGAEEKSGEKAPRVCELPTAEFAELLAEWREHAAEVKKKNVAERRKAAKRRAEEG